MIYISAMTLGIMSVLALQEIPIVLAEYVRTSQSTVAPVGAEVLTVGVIGGE
jgi:tartrate-resistant acid phosphatase type 5